MYANTKDIDIDNVSSLTTQSMMNRFKSLKRIPLLARKYAEQDLAEWELMPDGKRHLKVHQDAARKDRLMTIAKASVKYHKDPNYAESIRRRNRK